MPQVPPQACPGAYLPCHSGLDASSRRAVLMVLHTGSPPHCSACWAESHGSKLCLPWGGTPYLEPLGCSCEAVPAGSGCLGAIVCLSMWPSPYGESIFPATPVPQPLTLGSCEIKGVHGGHVLRREARGVTMAMSTLLHGPLCLLPHLYSTAQYFCCSLLIPEEAQGTAPQGPTAAIPGA